MDKYVAVFDVGTTAIKGIIFNKEGQIVADHSIRIQTHHRTNGHIEQNPLDWWVSLKTISASWFKEKGILPEQIAFITFSGQMEDVIPILRSGNAPFAILYSDMRAAKEAQEIRKKVSDLQEILGNSISGTTPLAKLAWMKKHQRAVYDDIHKVLFSSKDFLIYRLTDTYVTDPTTGSTTGMMNAALRSWDPALMEIAGFDFQKFPEIIDTGDIVGYVTEKAQKETGFLKDTPVLCGAGDGGATAMGAGAMKPGDSYAYVGTTGWMAVIVEEIQQETSLSSLFHLAHVRNNHFIRIIPLLNAGNVYAWAVDTFADGDYLRFEQLLQQSDPGSNGLLFLPYLNGERNPIHDPDAKGAFWGVQETSKKHDFARAVVEGIAFSLKQLAELLSLEEDEEIRIIGGITKSSLFCKILADCLNMYVSVPRNSEYMPAIGSSSSAFIQLGWVSNEEEFAERFIDPLQVDIYQPEMTNVTIYQENYNRFLKLYPNLKRIYQ